MTDTPELRITSQQLQIALQTWEDGPSKSDPYIRKIILAMGSQLVAAIDRNEAGVEPMGLLTAMVKLGIDIPSGVNSVTEQPIPRALGDIRGPMYLQFSRFVVDIARATLPAEYDEPLRDAVSAIFDAPIEAE